MELGEAFQPDLRRSTNESGVRCKERRVAVMNCKAHHVNANTLSLCRSIRHILGSRHPAFRVSCSMIVFGNPSWMWVSLFFFFRDFEEFLFYFCRGSITRAGFEWNSFYLISIVQGNVSCDKYPDPKTTLSVSQNRVFMSGYRVIAGQTRIPKRNLFRYTGLQSLRQVLFTYVDSNRTCRKDVW
jgi:hypothetical protein